ncbi:muscle M-line assembly protein unc-89-like isoform X2 [Mya arenaria]|uniref:muscle M-line assembly protein unc-89-like isoform X2 n=1 Tax=Mya arenaria TaxID=6604 RepID=UPI0022E1B6B6|nr:muscle M-line assembly protein unc-89-like isoform X2 [Mya arenaria]
MGKSMNLNNLTPEEAEQILKVIQKDFELRQKERERLSKIEEDISEEENKTEVLTKQKKFNENCCIRCCQTFGIIFNRRQLCQICHLYVCKACAKYDDSIKGYKCNACLKEKELKHKSLGWFYDNVSRKYRRFGSAKVVRTLYKHADSGRSKFHYSDGEEALLEVDEDMVFDDDGSLFSSNLQADNESDSGYDPSLYSSLCQSGSLRPGKSRPPLQGVFPEIRIQTEADREIDNGLFSPPPPLLPPVTQNTHNSQHSVSTGTETNGNYGNEESSSNTSMESIGMSTQTTPKHVPRMATTPTQTIEDLDTKEQDKRDIYKEAFESTKRTEEAKFKVRFDNLMSEMQQSFESLSPREGSMPHGYGSTSYGDLMTTYRAKIKDLLVSLSQRLELAVESFDESCATNPSLTSLKVRQMISKLVEDRLGESLDLTSDEAVSDLSSLSDDSSEQKSLEEQIAQAVIARMLEIHRNQNGIHLDLDEPRSADERRDSSGSEVKTVVRSRNSSIEEEQHVPGVNVPKDNHLSQSGKSPQSDNVHSDINSNISAKGVYIEPIGETSDNTIHLDNDNQHDIVDGGHGSNLDDSGNISPTKLTPNESADTSTDSISANKSVHNKKGEKRRLDSTNSEPDPEDEKILKSEFEKLRSFAKEVVPKPLYEEAKFTEEVESEPIEENMDYEEVDHEEAQDDFNSRFFTFDKVHDQDNRFPDFSELDYEYHDFGINEVDPDLLSMNLAPILEETEEELLEDEEEDVNNEGAVGGASEIDWRGNWMFKGASGIDSYESMSRSRVKPPHNFGEGIVRVPQPNVNLLAPIIGNRDVDEMSSDLSDDHDLSDEENSFYAKTSEEIARITRKTSSSSGQANNSVPTEGESDAESISSRPYSSSFSDYGYHGNQMDQNSMNTSKASIKSAVKLSEELVQSEKDDPKFEIPPISVTIAEGEPAKFNCRVGGTQPLDIFWYRIRDEIEELENSENYEIIKDGCRQNLTMYNMTLDDAGQYMCIAMNEHGRCCQYFILSVKKNTQDLKAPEFLKNLSDVEVAEGQSVKFRVKVKGIPQPRVVWYKDGQILLNKLNYKFDRFGNRDYILAIDIATMEEDAEYTALAKNIAGEAKSSAQLIVEPKNKPESVPKSSKSPKVDQKKDSSTSKKSTDDFPDLSYLRLGRGRNSSNTTTPSSSFTTPASKSSVATTSAANSLSSSTSNGTNGDDKDDNTLSATVPSEREDVSPSSREEVETDHKKSKPFAADVIMREKPSDIMATSTPRNSDTERVFNPDSDTSHITCDHSDVPLETGHDASNDSHKSEMSFNLNPMNINMGASAKDKTSSSRPKTGRSRSSSTEDDADYESRYRFHTRTHSNDGSHSAQSPNVSMDTTDAHNHSLDTSDEPLVVNLGPKRENKDRYRKDFYVTDTPLMSRKTPPTSPRDLTPTSPQTLTPGSPRDVMPLRDVTPAREETPVSPRARTEEKIVLATSPAPMATSSAPMVTSNQGNRSMSLAEKMRLQNSLQEQDKLTAAAQPQNKVPSTAVPAKKVIGSAQARQAPQPPQPRPITPPPVEKPEPTFLKGITSEKDIPESRTEFNEDYTIELPSVNRLKAMFGGTKSTEKDSSIKRIHSITARSVPKDQLEKLKQTTDDHPSARVALHSSSKAESIKLVQSGRATALTTGKQIKQTPNMPKQVFTSTEAHLSEHPSSKTHVPKQSIQIASNVKSSEAKIDSKAHTVIKLSLATGNTNKPISSEDSARTDSKQPIKMTQGKSQPKDNSVKTGEAIDTPEERKSPKIKTGAISAMSKFWEKVNTGVKEDAPEIIED